MDRENILDRAKEIVTTKRQYGKAEDNFSEIANLWGAYLHVDDLDEIDVSIMMILLKIARVGTGHSKDDNWIDMCGYAACGGEIYDKK